MADENGNGRAKFDWRMGLFVLAGWIGLGLIQWGTTSTQIADHARRIEIMEHQIAERSVAREEYDRRHEDLIRQVEEVRKELQDLRETEIRDTRK
jgi:hypothetical protein